MRRYLSPSSFLLLSPLLLGLGACKTVYSDMYSYRKNYFVPHEAITAAQEQRIKDKQLAERMSKQAENEAKAAADRAGSGGPSLQMDSGLGSSPSTSSAMGAGGFSTSSSSSSSFSPAGSSSAVPSRGSSTLGSTSISDSLLENPSAGAPSSPMKEAAPSQGASPATTPAMIPGL